MRPGVQGPLPCAAALHGAGTCIGYVVVQYHYCLCQELDVREPNEAGGNAVTEKPDMLLLFDHFSRLSTHPAQRFL